MCQLKVIVALRMLLSAIPNFLDQSKFMINLETGWFEKK
jgi:hypothetical protein